MLSVLETLMNFHSVTSDYSCVICIIPDVGKGLGTMSVASLPPDTLRIYQ